MSRTFKKLLAALVLIIALSLLLLSRRHRLSPVMREPGETNAPNRNEELAPARKETSGAALTGTPSRREIEEIRAQAEQHRRDSQREMELWRSPLLYFGKVVDENGVPIPGVQVSYGANSLNETGQETYRKGTVTTDARGIFKIDGIPGIGLMLQLSHPRYYSYADNSTGFDKRSTPKSGYFSDTEEKAQVFRMHGKGQPVPLISREGGLHKPADGTTMDFPLRGRTRAEIIGHLQAQAWKGDPDPQNNGHYDWKLRIAVPDGGVLQSTNEFAFAAPESGYEQILEISMSKDDPNWKPTTSKALFLKLPNYFARANANIDLYHDFYFSMQYFVNPNGSSNLENDPTQQIKEP